MSAPTPPFRFQAPHKNWFDRNPWWNLAFGACILLLIIAAWVCVPILVKMSKIHSSDVYQQSVKRAASNLEVRASLGEPVEAAWLVSGELTNELAKLSIPISGPKAKGVIHVVATKSYGIWWYYTWKVSVEGRSQLIELTGPAVQPTEPPSTQPQDSIH